MQIVYGFRNWLGELCKQNWYILINLKKSSNFSNKAKNSQIFFLLSLKDKQFEARISDDLEKTKVDVLKYCLELFLLIPNFYFNGAFTHPVYALHFGWFLDIYGNQYKLQCNAENACLNGMCPFGLSCVSPEKAHFWNRGWMQSSEVIEILSWYHKMQVWSGSERSLDQNF